MSTVELDPQEVEVKREVLWRQCAKDPVFFFENFWHIEHPAGRRKLKLRPAQQQTLDVWLNERYSITLKARQIGYSTLATALAFWRAFFVEDFKTLFLSRREDDARDLLKKVTYGFNRLPDWIIERGPKVSTQNLQTLEFDNGSMIRSDQSKNDPGRSQTVGCVVIDEWAFLENPEDAWASIEPITDIGGQVIGLSTANGMNYFATMYMKAKEGKSIFKSHFQPWWAVEERDQEWYESKKLNMLPWQLHQEYPRNDLEAFILSGQNVFDVEMLQALPVEPPAVRGHVVPEGTRSMMVRSAEDGPYFQWEPPNPNHRYTMGVDTAEGLEHGDYSVVWIVDTADGKCVAKWRGKIAADLLGSEVAFRIGWKYGAAFAVVEVNNHGLTTLNSLMGAGYPNIYFRTAYDEAGRHPTRKVGFQTHEKSKPVLIDELNKALRQGELLLPDEETIGEMMVYTRDERGRMSGSPHDDQVIAISLANLGRWHTFTPDWSVDHDITGSFEWWASLSEPKVGAPYLVGGTNVRD